MTKLREGDPDGNFVHVFDKAGNWNRFLISKEGRKNELPMTDAPAGMDMWLKDENGQERLVAENVYNAKFSPDGSKIAYTTSDAVLHVETLKGEKLNEVPQAYDPSWAADNTTVVYSEAPKGRPVSYPGTLAIKTLDTQSGQMQSLTDGSSDDTRPQFSPDNEWLIFVNGGRSGLASFWRVPKSGGRPEQITNVGLQDVNANFVPTPYMRAIWSADRRWFVYDFKMGEREETWGLQFDAAGKYLGARNLGEGIDPQWKSDGRTLASLKHDGERVIVVEHTLP